MDSVTTIGLDIAKSVFQVHGVDAVGAVIIRRKLTRGAGPRVLLEAAPMRRWDRGLQLLALLGEN